MFALTLTLTCTVLVRHQLQPLRGHPSGGVGPFGAAAAPADLVLGARAAPDPGELGAPAALRPAHARSEARPAHRARRPRPHGLRRDRYVSPLLYSTLLSLSVPRSLVLRVLRA